MSEATLARAMGALEAGSASEADSLAREAIEEARRAHGPDSAEVAATEFEHAHVLSAVGDVEGAVEAMRRSAAFAPTSDAGKKHRLTVLLNLGEALIHLGRLDEAERVLTEGVLERRDLYGPDHPGFAFGLEPLIELYLSRGRAADAKAGAEEALALFWRHGHRRVANALVLFAFAAKAEGGAGAVALDRLYALPAELVVEVVVGCLDRAAKLDPSTSLAVLHELMARGLAAGEEEPWLMHVAAMVSRLARRAGAHEIRDEALVWLVAHFDRIDDRRQALDAVLSRALARSEADDPAATDALYREASSRAEQLGDPLARSRALRNYGSWLAERARLVEATSALGEALALAEAADPDDPYRAEAIERARAALAVHAGPEN